MPSLQWIAGVAAVIKVCLSPVLFRMTITALLSIAPCMYIIQQVATMALLRCILVYLINMAAVAVQLCVFFTQSEIRLVMIKIRASPGAFCMAISTFFTEDTLVDIIFFVARYACGRGAPVFFFPYMTAFAANNRVCASKRIISCTVVKGLSVQLDDIRIAAYMIGMTMTALGFPCLRTSMKTMPAHDVGIDFLMAVPAKRALFLFAERLVTAVAFLFIFRMALNNLAWHHQCFHASCCCVIYGNRERGSDDA